MSNTTYVRRICKVYRAATADELAQGIEWYARARRIAVELDPANPERAAGVIAALSPLMPWSRNVELARRAYALGTVTGALGANCRKAQEILDGADPLNVLRGQKVRAFYLTIVNPAHPDAVVVDRHAHDVAWGSITTDSTRGGALSTKKGYAEFCEAYRRAAAILGVTPSQVQAVTWTVHRNRHAAGWAARDLIAA